MHRRSFTVFLTVLLSTAVVASGWLDLGPRLPSVGDSSSSEAVGDRPTHADLYGDPLPPGAVARLGTSRFRGSDRYCAVAFSPDGKTLAALGDEAEVSLWDVASGKQIYREPFPEREGGSDPNSSQVHAILAFSPDGKTLLVGWDWIGKYRPLCLWDVAERKERLRMEGARNGFRSAVVSADFRTLAVAAADGRVGLWDVASGKPRPGWSVPEIDAQLVALSADGGALATGGEDRTIRLWDAGSGKQIHAFPAREPSIAALAFSPDGKTLASEDRAESVVFYDVIEGTVNRQWETGTWRVHTSSDLDDNVPFYLLAFSPDGRTLILWDRDCTLNLWDVASGKRRRALPGDPIQYCCFSRDGKTLAGAGNGFLGLWDAASGEALYPAHDFAVSQIRFSPDGRDVITLAGNKVRRWDAASGRLKCLVWTRSNAVLTADGRTAIDRLEGHWGEIVFYDTASDEWPLYYELNEAAGGLLALSPDNRTLAVGRRRDAEDQLILVDLGAGGVPRLAALRPPWREPGALVTLNGTIGTPRRVGDYRPFSDKIIFSPDGRTLAVVGPIPAPSGPEEGGRGNLFQGPTEEGQRCRLWDVASGRLRREFTAGSDYPWGGGIVLSPDGRLLARGYCDGTVRLWETATGREARRWSTGPKIVCAVAFSPDGRTLAASDGGFDPVSLWDVDAGWELGRLAGHGSGALAALTFSPDGRRLASGSDTDGTALVWDVAAVVRRERPPALRFSSTELSDLWTDLGRADSPRAHEAVVRLARAPEQAVAFLEGRRATRAAGADAARVARLIAALDDDAFDAREKAQKELAEVADMAAPMLRQRLKDEGLSPEARLGVQQVLIAMDDLTEPVALQWLRATDVLERVGTPGACRLLEKLAAAEGPSAEAAEASLKRVARRRAAP